MPKSDPARKSTIFEALDFFNHSYKINGTDETFNIFGGVESVLNYNQQEKGDNNLGMQTGEKHLPDANYSI